MSVLIGADIAPVGGAVPLFENGDIGELAGAALAEEINKADFRVFNLESPLTDTLSPIEKHGPHLAAPVKCVSGLTALKADLVTLANNHIMDQGAGGLCDTVRALDAAGIAFFGAGEDLAAAERPFTVEIGGVRYGFLACAEKEFSIAGENTPGAAAFDPLETPDRVAALKARCGRVAVLYHGGREHYPYPSPGLRRTCRKLAEKGADLVVCQHSHSIGCMEVWQGSTIVYGQGNFLFDGSDEACWRESLLIRIGDDGSVSFLPLKKAGSGVRLAEGAEGERILEDFRRRSEEILKPGFVEEKYAALAEEALTDYLRIAHGRRPFPLRALNRLTGGRVMKALLHSRYRAADRAGIMDCLSCEAHRELFLKGLEDEYGKA